jgi:hypothetical protein
MTTPPPAAPDPPAASPPPAPPATSSGEGDSLDARIGRIIDAKLGQLHGQAQQHTEARLNRGTDMEEAARREVERLRAEDAAQAQQDARNKQLDQVTADVAEMRETKPAAPVRYIERLMWGGSRNDR